MNEEFDVIDLISREPAPGKVHISYTGPLPKGKEWMALGRLSAPTTLPQLKMEGADEFLDFLATMGADGGAADEGGAAEGGE